MIPSLSSAGYEISENTLAPLATAKLPGLRLETAAFRLPLCRLQWCRTARQAHRAARLVGVVMAFVRGNRPSDAIKAKIKKGVEQHWKTTRKRSDAIMAALKLVEELKLENERLERELDAAHAQLTEQEERS